MTPLPPYEHLELRPPFCERCGTGLSRSEAASHDGLCCGCGAAEVRRRSDAFLRDIGEIQKPAVPRAVIGWLLVSLAVVLLSALAAWLLVGSQWRNDGDQAYQSEQRADTAARHEQGGAGDRRGSDARVPDRLGGAEPRRDVGLGARTAGVVPATVGVLTGLPDTASVERGTATWCAPTPTHCQSWGGGAKLGAVASFRYGDKPYRVRVCLRGTDRCTRVTVVSYCACGSTLIDLSPSAFRQLAPLSRGRIHVTVTRTLPFLPPTDTP